MKRILNSGLEFSASSLWFLNTFSGVIGGFWILVLGGGKLVLIGVLLSFIMPFLYSLAVLPQLIFVPLITKSAENGHKLLTAVLAFFVSGYNNFIFSVWASIVFAWITSYTEFPIVPLLLLGYSVTISPLGYMASKEGSDAGMGTFLGVLFTQITFISLAINFFIGNSPIMAGMLIWLLILIFTLATSVFGYASVKGKAE